MAAHPSILTWESPWTEEPGGPQAVGFQRVVHGWAHMYSLAIIKITVGVNSSHEIKRHLLLGKKAMTNLNSILKSSGIHFANKGLSSQSCGFSTGHVWMWELDHKEGWAQKNWCFQIVLERTLESPLDSKEIKSVNPKRNKPWIFTGRTDAAAEAPVLWPPDVKSRLTGKDPDTGKDWGQGREGGNRGWDGWMASPTQWISLSKLRETVKDREAWGHKQLDTT